MVECAVVISSSSSVAPRHTATCTLSIVGSGKRLSVVQYNTPGDEHPDGFRIITAGPQSSSLLAIPTAAGSEGRGRIPTSANLLSVALKCSSEQGPIPVFVNGNLLTTQHVQNFTGVQVHNQSGSDGWREEWNVDNTTHNATYSDDCGLRQRASKALLHFCGDCHLEFTNITIHGVQLTPDIEPSTGPIPLNISSPVVLFGSALSHSSLTVNIHQAHIVNTAAHAALCVTGGSQVNISDMNCRGSLGQSGACLAVTDAAVVQLSSSVIDNCTAVRGAGLFVSGNARVGITNSTFANCLGVTAGGAIQARDQADLEIHNSTFVYNRVADQHVTYGHGGALAVVDNASARIYRSSCHHNTAAYAGGAVSVVDQAYCEVNNSTFESNRAVNHSMTDGWGGALIARGNGTVVRVKAVTFSNNTAAYAGGAVSVVDHANLKVNNSIFESNRAVNHSMTGGRGGALIASGNGTVVRVEAVTFSNNTAAYAGGAVSVVDHANLKVNNSIFQSNRAVNHNMTDGWGGGLLLSIGSTAKLLSAVFLRNTAVFAGGAVYAGQNATVEIRKSILSSNLVVNPNKTQGGGGALVAHDNVTVNISDSSIENNSATAIGGAILVNALAGSNLNLKNASSEKLQATKDDNEVQASVVVLQHCIVSSNHAGQEGGGFRGMVLDGSLLRVNLNGSTYTVNDNDVQRSLMLNGSDVLRKGGLCVRGDKTPTADGFCEMCPEHMYSLDPHPRQRSCTPCPLHATCFGGAVVVANDTFFNTYNMSNKCNPSNIIRCPNPQACSHTVDDSLVRLHPYFYTFITTSSDQSITDKLSWLDYTRRLCETGYKGATASSAGDDDKQLRVTDVLKALIMYAQAANYENPQVDRSSLKALINLLLPVLVFLLVLSCQIVWFISHTKGWCIRSQYQASRPAGWSHMSGLTHYMRQRWVVTLLATLFFFYPSVARIAVSMFTCITVCDEHYWVMDMDLQCPRSQSPGSWSGYAKWAAAVGIPALVCMVLVPVSVASLLLWAAGTKRLHSLEFQTRFGFMYSDYKTDLLGRRQLKTSSSVSMSPDIARRLLQQHLSLVWDAVIHVQTVVLVCVSVVGMLLHEYYQTLILTAVFGTYLILIAWLRPFRNRSVQRLQDMSSATLCLTCLLILFFIPPDYMDDRQNGDYKKAQPICGALLIAANEAKEGVLILSDAAPAPFPSMAKLFDSVTPELAARANTAYSGGGTRLVWKDAHGKGRGGPLVDDKRVIDLSAHRMQQLTSIDPGLARELGSPLVDSLSFFDSSTAHTAPVVLEALKEATGCADYGMGEARFAYRMVDYGSRAGGAVAPPRCSAHRDFGTATLIWQDGPGLEVRVGEAWHTLPALPPSSAVLMFGLCTAWRSNDRIRAAEHRVGDAAAGPGGVSPRRLSAVLFMGLCDTAVLAPALSSAGERPRYVSAQVGSVHPVVRRKWSWREGSVTADEKAAEELERQQYTTQEDLIAALYKLPA
eukprot:gene12393-12528_t